MLFVAACSPSRGKPQPDPASAQFRSAWEKRQAGDQAGYLASLREIGAMYPRSRAGKRAQETLATANQPRGGSTGAAATGIMAAIAIPAFAKFRARAAGQGHAKPDLAGPVFIEKR